MPLLMFPDAGKRIDRAVKHAQAFTGGWNTLLKPEAYRIEIHMDSERTGVVRAVVDTLPENDLALELGEFFYQLRAALDGIIYQMTVIEGGGADPPADENRIEFPIYPNAKKFETSAANTGPLPDNLKVWLQSVQPYNAGKAVDANTEDFIRVLKLLHDCARKDRHRKLHFLAAIPTSSQFNFRVESPGVITFATPIPANFMDNESVFLRFGVEGISVTRNEQIHLDADMTIQIAVAEIPNAVGAEVGHELQRMVTVVRALVQLFEDGYSRH